MPLRNSLPSPWFRDREFDEGDAETIGHGWRRVSQLVARLIVGAIGIAGAAVILAPVLSQDVHEPSEPVVVANHVQLVQAGAFSPDGKTFVTCGVDHGVRLWDANSLNHGPGSEPVILDDDAVKYAVAFSPDGSLLGAVGPKSLTIWSTKSGKYARILERRIDSSSSLAFSPDGHTLAIGSDAGAVSLHDLPSAEERVASYAHSDAVRNLSFSPDGHFLVSAGQDSLIVFWDTVRGVSIRTVQKTGCNPNHLVAFSPDGRLLAVGEIGGGPADVELVDASDGSVRTKLTGHTQGVCALTFSPDGRTLATAGADQSVKLWNLSSGKELITFNDEVGSVNSLLFSSDGAWLALAGDGVGIKDWEHARSRSPRLTSVRKKLVQKPGVSS